MDAITFALTRQPDMYLTLSDTKAKTSSASFVITEEHIFPHSRVQRNFYGFQVLVTTESLQKAASRAHQKCTRKEHSKINQHPPARVL